MTRRPSFIPVLLLIVAAAVSSAASSCATSKDAAKGATSSTVSTVSTRHDALELLEAAEALHHCAGEEATDEARGQALAACMDTNEHRVHALLPGIKAAGSMQPGPLAAVRLLINDVADDPEREVLCAQLPAGDFLTDSGIDEEAHAGCGHP